MHSVANPYKCGTRIGWHIERTLRKVDQMKGAGCKTNKQTRYGVEMLSQAFSNNQIQIMISRHHSHKIG